MFDYLVYFISLRYIKTRLITVLCTMVVAVGVMVLLVVLSVMDGFKKEFKSRLQGSLSDILITVRDANVLYKDAEEIILKNANVEACSPHLNGLVLIGTGRFYAPGMIMGIDYEKEYNVGKLKDYLVTAYKEKKLWAEELLEQNIKRSYYTSFSWKVLGGKYVPAEGIFPAGTRIVCQEICQQIRKNSSLSNVQSQESYIAFTMSDGDKPQIIFIETDVSFQDASVGYRWYYRSNECCW